MAAINQTYFNFNSIWLQLNELKLSLDWLQRPSEIKLTSQCVNQSGWIVVSILVIQWMNWELIHELNGSRMPDLRIQINK